MAEDEPLVALNGSQVSWFCFGCFAELYTATRLYTNLLTCVNYALLRLHHRCHVTALLTLRAWRFRLQRHNGGKEVYPFYFVVETKMQYPGKINRTRCACILLRIWALELSCNFSTCFLLKISFIGHDCKDIPDFLAHRYGHFARRLDLSFNQLR